MNLVDIENLTVGKKGISYIENVTLTIKKGEHWVFLGANGSGKTVLGRLLYEETKPDAGYVSFEREKMVLDREHKDDDSDLLDYPDPGRTAAEFILENGGSSQLMKDLARQFNFTELLDRGIKYLSSGEMRKILIAESLMNAPRILILDEPYDALDHQSREELTGLLRLLTEKEITIVLILNRFSEIPDFITHAGYLQEKKLILKGKTADIMESEELNRLHYFQSSVPETLPSPLFRDEYLFSGNLLVKMNKINVSYGEKTVLKELDWSLNKGEHWKISGPNGVGKSTMLSLISGDNPQAYANDLTLFGMKRGSGETVWDIKKHIGFVSSSFQTEYRVNTSA
ncbi:MAG: ATP-binding cassette domain-containing protein, partial [Proteobacteria bacterium]|nr:ATP-binding cassette domain-containing protein [Pseudomonadota bacterium]